MIPAIQKILPTAWSWWVVGSSGGAVEWRMGTSRPLRIGQERTRPQTTCIFLCGGVREARVGSLSGWTLACSIQPQQSRLRLQAFCARAAVDAARPASSVQTSSRPASGDACQGEATGDSACTSSPGHALSSCLSFARLAAVTNRFASSSPAGSMGEPAWARGEVGAGQSDGAASARGGFVRERRVWAARR